MPPLAMHFMTTLMTGMRFLDLMRSSTRQALTLSNISSVVHPMQSMKRMRDPNDVPYRFLRLSMSPVSSSFRMQPMKATPLSDPPDKTRFVIA